MAHTPHSLAATRFFGWRVVYAAFVVAFFGWGMGFFGPPVFLQAVHENRGWPVELVSVALTTHYLVGASVVANLPRLYRWFGLPIVTAAGAVLLTVGLLGWAAAAEPWQLFLSTVLSGAGWAAMGGAAINALIAPWFARLRPKALSWAYNGASIGGFLFSPLWVFLIARVGFFSAVLVVGAVAIVTVCCLSVFIFSRLPENTGQRIEAEPGGIAAPTRVNLNPRLPGTALWRDWKFRTLALGMSLGLFAQIGALSQLFSVSAPALGAAAAGAVLGLANLLSAGARAAIGTLLPANADRRTVAIMSYGVQVLGGVALIQSSGRSPALIIAGTLLFGIGIGNATSLPPLIAQVEFSQEDGLRAVALIVAISQATYAFAPATFGIFRNLARSGRTFPASEMAAVAIAAAGLQFLAICVFFAGRSARQTPESVC